MGASGSIYIGITLIYWLKPTLVISMWSQCELAMSADVENHSCEEEPSLSGCLGTRCDQRASEPTAQLQRPINLSLGAMTMYQPCDDQTRHEA